jgi:hypothetical protein
MCQKKERERNSTCFDVVQEEFEDSKGVIRIRIHSLHKKFTKSSVSIVRQCNNRLCN